MKLIELLGIEVFGILGFFALFLRYLSVRKNGALKKRAKFILGPLDGETRMVKRYDPSFSYTEAGEPIIYRHVGSGIYEYVE
jgi:hypothetical protein